MAGHKSLGDRILSYLTPNIVVGDKLRKPLESGLYYGTMSEAEDGSYTFTIEGKGKEPPPPAPINYKFPPLE